MNIDLSVIKPLVKGESDKFSWNLYRVLKQAMKEKKKFPILDYRIFYYDKSDIDGSIVALNKTQSLPPWHCYFAKIYPMNQGWAGAKLSDIMRPGKNEFYAYGVTLKAEHLTDITDWFLREYVKLGRCIFDREHNGWWQGDDKRFTNINKHSRRCNWCGEWQRREIGKAVTIKRVEAWEKVEL